MNLADFNTVEKLLSQAGFSFKKSLGQNFIVDPTVCPEMAAAALDENTGALEIGPGIGVLTAELARVAKKVVSIELDRRLESVLSETLAGFDNISFIWEDCMKVDLKKLFLDIKINLYYWIS